MGLDNPSLLCDYKPMKKTEYEWAGRKFLIEKVDKDRKAGTAPKNRNWAKFTMLLLVELDENGKILGFVRCREKRFQRKTTKTGRVLVFDAKFGGYREAE